MEYAAGEFKILLSLSMLLYLFHHEVVLTAIGGDLQAKVNRRKIAFNPFTEDEILFWLAQLLEALLLIHQQGMLHRDIKLANMFLTYDDELKLGDFGIARVLDANAANISARTCRTPVGTPMYMVR
jgi:NIMA (never in mitosis gene a)-related kinase